MGGTWARPDDLEQRTEAAWATVRGVGGIPVVQILQAYRDESLGDLAAIWCDRRHAVPFVEAEKSRQRRLPEVEVDQHDVTPGASERDREIRCGGALPLASLHARHHDHPCSDAALRKLEICPERVESVSVGSARIPEQRGKSLAALPGSHPQTTEEGGLE